jgi:hypothetical protein
MVAADTEVFINPYEVLGILRTCEPEVIKAAYKVMMKKHHPDYGGSTERAAILTWAYDILSDPIQKWDIDAKLDADLYPNEDDTAGSYYPEPESFFDTEYEEWFTPEATQPEPATTFPQPDAPPAPSGEAPLYNFPKPTPRGFKVWFTLKVADPVYFFFWGIADKIKELKAKRRRRFNAKRQCFDDGMSAWKRFRVGVRVLNVMFPLLFSFLSQTPYLLFFFGVPIYAWNILRVQLGWSAMETRVSRRAMIWVGRLSGVLFAVSVCEAFWWSQTAERGWVGDNVTSGSVPAVFVMYVAAALLTFVFIHHEITLVVRRFLYNRLHAKIITIFMLLAYCVGLTLVGHYMIAPDAEQFKTERWLRVNALRRPQVADFLNEIADGWSALGIYEEHGCPYFLDSSDSLESANDKFLDERINCFNPKYAGAEQGLAALRSLGLQPDNALELKSRWCYGECEDAITPYVWWEIDDSGAVIFKLDQATRDFEVQRNYILSEIDRLESLRSANR